MAAITIDLLESLLNRGDYVHMAPDGSITVAERGSMKAQYEEMRNDLDITRRELHTLKALLNTPETEDFDKGVQFEATHQIQAGKQPEDWFWLCGYLAGKALSSFKAGDVEKAKHHCVTTAAVMRNWHKAIATGESAMRPGISAEKASIG